MGETRINNCTMPCSRFSFVYTVNPSYTNFTNYFQLYFGLCYTNNFLTAFTNFPLFLSLSFSLLPVLPKAVNLLLQTMKLAPLPTPTMCVYLLLCFIVCAPLLTHSHIKSITFTPDNIL